MIDVGFGQITFYRLADLIEIRLLFGEPEVISIAEVVDWLEEDGSLADQAVYDEAEGDLATIDEPTARRRFRDEAAEGASPEYLLAEEAFIELEHRAASVGMSYPMTIEGRQARLNVGSWRDSLAYAFLVALSARYTFKLPANLGAAARLFERLIVPALQRYWGGKAIHFGWPRSDPEVAAFPPALAALIRTIRERLNVRAEEVPARLKDLAVDAVAWRPVDDRRGQTVMLCQSAIGADWETKGIDIEQWEKLVTFAVRPTRGLAFPFVAESMRDLTAVDWELLCGSVGVPFDRLRLAHLLGGADIEDLEADIEAWIEPFVSVIREAA
jgi:hypothetical protein